jgi:hypothetical protein
MRDLTPSSQSKNSSVFDNTEDLAAKSSFGTDLFVSQKLGHEPVGEIYAQCGA